MGRSEDPDAYKIGPEEKVCLEEFLRKLLRYTPGERATPSEALDSEWMKNWALPKLASARDEVNRANEALGPKKVGVGGDQESKNSSGLENSMKKMSL